MLSTTSLLIAAATSVASQATHSVIGPSGGTGYYDNANIIAYGGAITGATFVATIDHVVDGGAGQPAGIDLDAIQNRDAYARGTGRPAAAGRAEPWRQSAG